MQKDTKARPTKQLVARYAIVGFLILSAIVVFIAVRTGADSYQVTTALFLTGIGMLYAYHVATISPVKQSEFLRITDTRVLIAAGAFVFAATISLISSVKLYTVGLSYALALPLLLHLRGAKPTPGLQLPGETTMFFTTALFAVCPALVDFDFNWMGDVGTTYFIAVAIYGVIIATALFSGYRQLFRKKIRPMKGSAARAVYSHPDKRVSVRRNHLEVDAWSGEDGRAWANRPIAEPR